MNCPRVYKPSIQECKVWALKNCNGISPDERVWLRPTHCRPRRSSFFYHMGFFNLGRTFYEASGGDCDSSAAQLPSFMTTEITRRLSQHPELEVTASTQDQGYPLIMKPMVYFDYYSDTHWPKHPPDCAQDRLLYYCSLTLITCQNKRYISTLDRTASCTTSKETMVCPKGLLQLTQLTVSHGRPQLIYGIPVIINRRPVKVAMIYYI